MDNLTKIQGLLTSRIETKTKNKETYYYGFFQLILTDCPECGDASGQVKVGKAIRLCKVCHLPKEDIPVIFKLPGQDNQPLKPTLTKGSQVELEGTWANSQKDRPSFTCYKYFLLKLPDPPSLPSLQKELSSLLRPALDQKKSWSETTDFLFKKQKDLEEIRKVSQLGENYLQAYLLTKQVFYANYQTEHLEQANFTLQSYLTRIASELDLARRQMLASGWREIK